MAYIQSFLEGLCIEDRVLVPYKTLTIWLSCKPKEIGLHTCIVHFDVGDERIERVVFLLAEDKVSRSLASANKRCHSRVQRRISFPGDNVYPAALRPAKAKKHGMECKLPQFEIPEDTRELLEKKLVPAVIKETKENYAEYFSTLLIMEELHLEREMRNHDIDGATMRRKGAHFLALGVLGLAERKPSLLQGDHVLATFVSRNANDTSPAYQGVVCRIEASEVLLKFPNAFHANHQHENIYSIKFTYNRVCMRRLYQAVKAAENLESCILFPSKSTERSQKTSSIVPPMSLNEEQLRCVEMILRCDGSPPYIIHGPPGTGKTTTLVAAILQIYATREEARILVCAASNSAADHILEKLIENNVAKVKENDILRLNASSRAYEDVNPNILRFSCSDAYIFRCPPLKALLHYKLIISTYMSSSILYAEGFGRDHFSHIFLDEAGQSSEPETMVPLSSLSRKETVVVLAGDPAQLGPVVYSNEAVKYGLGKSFLERLFECELYRNEENRFITRLLRNYRCHPTILNLPSKLFYEGTLIASKDVSPSPKSWLNILPRKEFNVLFIGIQGSDEQQGKNPSWFNRIEASKVIDLVKKLTESTDLSDSDIGVIAPYRQQVAKISEALKALEFSDVKVGSVEQFQGQEREVIIVSTVRSTAKHNTFDRTHSIGFLSNPRRFNVAITRAKSLLIVVSNPHIVSMDPYWHKLLWYCADNNSYQGCPLPER